MGKLRPRREPPHPGEAQKAGVCPPTLWLLFAFNPPPIAARPRGGETPTARLSAATPAARAHPTLFPWPNPDVSALYPGTLGTVHSPLPGSAMLAQHRPGTVRAGAGAKCIFGLGKQWCRCAPSSSAPHWKVLSPTPPFCPIAEGTEVSKIINF